MSKKSQTAMEFLLTYGWAILVAIVAIAALAYFGVLTPNTFLPERCQGPSGMDCVDLVSTGTNNVTFVLRNNNGGHIRIQKIASMEGDCIINSGPALFNVSGGNTLYNQIIYNKATEVSLPRDVDNSEQFGLTILCSKIIKKGNFKIAVTLQYLKSDTGLTHNALISINAKK
jgi:hypothetical protein